MLGVSLLLEGRWVQQAKARWARYRKVTVGFCARPVDREGSIRATRVGQVRLGAD